MSHWSEVQFSIHQRPLSPPEIEKARVLVQENMRALSQAKSRLFWRFLLQSACLLVVLWVVGRLSHELLDWRWDSFVRIFTMCATAAFFILHVANNYHKGASIAADELQFQRLQTQLDEVDDTAHVQFAQDNLFVFDVISYVNEVNSLGRRLLVGEMKALRAALSESVQDESSGESDGRRTYV